MEGLTKMSVTVIGILVALLVGGGGGAFITNKIHSSKAPEVVVVEPDGTAEKQQDVVLQLTDLDLVKEACSSQYIIEQTAGEGLCREMFCRMQQRGVDAKTGATECEKISNVNNKITIMNFCNVAASVEMDKEHLVTDEKGNPILDEEGNPKKDTVTVTVIDPTELENCINFFDRRI